MGVRYKVAHYGPRSLGNGPVRATGGTETVIEQDGKFYRVHTFTDVGENNFEVLRDGKCDVLVVAGGGGGGGASGNGGSGGGGGGVVKAKINVGIGNNNVFVGGGGPRGDGTGNIGFNGEDSEIFGLVALGGGGGEGGGTASGKSGGSGGGSRRDENFRGGDFGLSLQQGTNPSAIVDAGNDGGIGPPSGGGGGGAGGPGGTNNGTGGPGLLINFDGTSRFFGSGGNGQFSTETSGGQTTDQEETLPNVGAGGAGTFSSTRVGNVGIGGSGIVIVRYRITEAEFNAA